jgi:hypothetical protein
MPPKNRRAAFLAASKVAGKQAPKTTAKKGQNTAAVTKNPSTARELDLAEKRKADEAKNARSRTESVARSVGNTGSSRPKPSIRFNELEDISTPSPPSRPRSRRVKMIVPEPLLSSSPLTLELHAENESEEDSLPLRKRHRREMSEDSIDRAFHGLNDIIQLNERLKAKAKKKKHKRLDLMDQQRASYLLMLLSIHLVPMRFCLISSRG